MRLINVLKGVKPISYFSFATIKNPYCTNMINKKYLD